MLTYTKQIEVRWADLDPNFHVRHSVYYDFGAYVRMSILTELGLGIHVMQENHLGPILFREECVFKRELQFGDTVTINLIMAHCSPTYSRWTFRHEVYKNGDTLAAIITVDGAWMDTTKRKLIVPPDFITPAFDMLPRAADFVYINKKN